MPSPGEEGTVQLVCSFLLSRLDYCNSLIIDITSDQMYRLQKYSKACSQSRFSQKQTWAVIVSWCFQPSQPQRVASGLANMNMLHHFSKKASLAPSQRKDTFQDNKPLPFISLMVPCHQICHPVSLCALYRLLSVPVAMPPKGGRDV